MRLLTRIDQARARRPESAFTMVEIALSLAVVAFALVAIMGVLPTGMTVQKDNREDTLINQEGRYWLEAIKTGAIGLDDLTNYVEEITLYQEYEGKQTRILSLSNTVSKPWTSFDIIGLMTTPKYGSFFTYPNGAAVTNKVVARVKAMSGSAAEKGPLTNEFSFRYEVESELVPNFPLPAGFLGTNTVVSNYNSSVGRTLHDVRLILRWPVVQKGNGWFIGNSRKKFRGKMVGTPVGIPNTSLGITNWSIVQNLFLGTGGGGVGAGSSGGGSQ